MLTGTIEGRFLELLVFGTGARRVLEIGTYSGYSALSMAAGCRRTVASTRCEIEPKHAEVAQRYFAAAPTATRSQFTSARRWRRSRQLEGDFDFVFIDADKGNYANYLEAVLPRLPRAV